MKKTINFLCCIVTALMAATFTGCSSDSSSSASKPDLEFIGLTSTNTLVKYNANNTTTAISTTSITGLQPGENLLAIDFRPANGQLYGLGSTSRLYMINSTTGNAIAVGATAFTPALTGTLTGFDFNPTVDRVRIVTSSGVNFRLNPDTGLLAGTDTNLNPGTPNISSAAYTNNTFTATTSSLYVIDNTTGMLYLQNPPNAGTLTAVGSLGVSGITGDGGFDIDPTDGIAIASLNAGGSDNLYQIDLTTGAATDLGELSTPIIGLAIPAAPIAFTVDASNNLQIFNFKNPGTPTVKALVGLQAGETILGIDMRPSTGQLYALGSTGRIYVIFQGSGSATVVGAGPAFVPNGTDFGFDFNPVADRIRIVSNTGQNLRVNPDTGVAANDSALSPGSPNVTGAAYTNNYAGATTTTLYDIDTTTDMLYTQNPPNNGTLASVGALGVNATASNGFDIGSTSNTAYAILTVGGTSGIYTINTTTGAATLVTAFPTASVRGFTLGLGF